MAKNQQDMKMDMDELGFFLFMEEQERKEKEQQQQEGAAMATRTDTNIMDFDEDDGLKRGHGKKASQKLKPYLVLQILMEHADEDHAVYESFV